MRAHARELVTAAAQALAGKAHTFEDLHDALYQLALDIVTPWQRAQMPSELRRRPVAGEALPRHQRASWARGRTIYDVDEA